MSIFKKKHAKKKKKTRMEKGEERKRNAFQLYTEVAPRGTCRPSRTCLLCPPHCASDFAGCSVPGRPCLGFFGALGSLANS